MSARRLTFRCNYNGGIDVPHPILAHHTTAGALLGAHVPTQESDEYTDVDAYLNTAMFST
jgi:hypothetical protein